MSLSLRLYKSNIKQRFCLSTRRIYIILRNALVQFVNLTFLRISDLIIYNVQSHGQNYFHVCYMSSIINVIRLRIVLLSEQRLLQIKWMNFNILCKPNFIRVREMSEKFSRASLSRIFIAANQSLSYGCYVLRRLGRE